MSTQLPVLTTAELRAKKDAIDAELRVAKRRQLRLLLDANGFECLNPALLGMNTDQLEAMRYLVGAYQTLDSL